MDIGEELVIEYKRLRRHYNYLHKRWSDSVARDLSSCLRNWVQLAEEADSYATIQRWDLSFPVFNKSKDLNKLLRRSNGERTHFPSGATSGGITVYETVVFNEIMDDEISENMPMKQTPESPEDPKRKKTNLVDWLDVEVSELANGKVRRGILRKEYIVRVANTLGGAHPVNAPDRDIYYKDIDKFIANRVSNVTANMPEPYAFLMEAAQGILRTYESFLTS